MASEPALGGVPKARVLQFRQYRLEVPPPLQFSRVILGDLAHSFAVDLRRLSQEPHLVRVAAGSGDWHRRAN